MIPIDKVREIIKKHEILEKELSSGAIEKKLFASKSKEYSELNAVISHAKDYLTFDNFDKLKPDFCYFLELIFHVQQIFESIFASACHSRGRPRPVGGSGGKLTAPRADSELALQAELAA